jgi:hypothetical protein
VWKNNEMKNDEFESNKDFFDFVTAMSSHLLELGFEEAHLELSRILSTAWTTSSVVFGELGLASKRIMRRDGKRLPPCLKEDLEKCLSVCKSALK